MSVTSKQRELKRLIKAFEREADKFHDLQLHVFHVTPNGTTDERVFAPQNHVIMLWQYYEALEGDEDAEQFIADVQSSDTKWGLRGCSLSQFGVIEGNATALFVRMATRAGCLFSKRETRTIKSRVLSEIQDAEKAKKPSAKPTGVTNNHPLAIWLNYLLYHLSLTIQRETIHARSSPIRSHCRC
jgi:hypothetical protein